MSKALKDAMSVIHYRQKSAAAVAAGREIAKDCDRRLAVAKKALKGIDEFAWSMVSLPEAARKNLQRRVDACRKALKNLEPFA